MVNVTQQDLHDLLEIFEKKSFEAVAFEEGTTVSPVHLNSLPLTEKACDTNPLKARARAVTLPMTVTGLQTGLGGSATGTSIASLPIRWPRPKERC